MTQRRLEECCVASGRAPLLKYILFILCPRCCPRCSPRKAMGLSEGLLSSGTFTFTHAPYGVDSAALSGECGRGRRPHVSASTCGEAPSHRCHGRERLPLVLLRVVAPCTGSPASLGRSLLSAHFMLPAAAPCTAEGNGPWWRHQGHICCGRSLRVQTRTTPEAVAGRSACTCGSAPSVHQLS